MATDPNAAPVGSDAGTLSLESDISKIEGEYEPRVLAEEHAAEGYESQSVEQSQMLSEEAESAAGEIPEQEAELQHWLQHTPTRQAAYATSMHAAPLLAILTALGGKVTRLNGQQMLAATNGIVQGLNSASESNYESAYQAWQAAYARMKDHQAALMRTHQLMLEAYKGRADAYQRAAEAARRMTGDILDDKQRKIAERIDTFKATAAVMDKAARVKLAYAQLHERTMKDLAQESHWKALEQKSAALPGPLKAELAQEKFRWQNAKSKQDENLKARGQISNRIDLPEAVKNEELQRLDNENAALDMEMSRAVTNADAMLAGYTASRGAGGASPRPTSPSPAGGGAGGPSGLAPGSTLPPENPGRAGNIKRPGSSVEVEQPPPQALALLKQHQGTAVTFANDQTWIMDAQGNVSRVQ